MYKRRQSQNKITPAGSQQQSYPQNQKTQFCTVIENLTPTIRRSSSTKHIEDLLTNSKFLLLSMSSVGIFPLVVTQATKHTSVKALDFQIALVGKSS